MELTRLRPARATGPLAPLAWLLAALDLAVAWLIVVLLSAMVAIVSAQVALRYGVNSSIGWADEVSRLTFVWTMFLAIPLGIKAGAHIGIELVTDRLPPALRGGLQRLMAAIAMAMMLLVAWQTILLAADQWAYSWSVSATNATGSAVGAPGSVGFATAPSPCPGDINGDGMTNAADFNILATSFGQSVPIGTGADIAQDGVVNTGDFNVLASEFGCGT